MSECIDINVQMSRHFPWCCIVGLKPGPLYWKVNVFPHSHTCNWQYDFNITRILWYCVYVQKMVNLVVWVATWQFSSQEFCSQKYHSCETEKKEIPKINKSPFDKKAKREKKKTREKGLISEVMEVSVLCDAWRLLFGLDYDAAWSKNHPVGRFLDIIPVLSTS